MNRTIIDILNVGDQERFHSSMIAWLLDPEGEHGFKHAFGDRLFATLPQVAQAPVKTVDTEKADSGVRYDIFVQTEDGTPIVIENKTKSFGGGSQLTAYQNRIGKGKVVGLGLHEINFDIEERREFPLITYREVLQVLQELGDNSGDDAFTTLVQQYRVFLDRELGRLEAVRRAFFEGEEAASLEIVRDREDWIRKNDNNRRFYNSFYLAILRDRLNAEQSKEFRWIILKDVQSGVVMYQANPADDSEHPSWALESKYLNVSSLRDYLRQFHQNEDKWDAHFWIEIELDQGVFAADGEQCGEIRLKASHYPESRLSAPEIQVKFEDSYEHERENGEEFPRRHASANNNTFTLLHRPLWRADLCLNVMKEILDGWIQKHGLKLR